jgi:tetratricopeptide (TPR) repeat protein
MRRPKTKSNPAPASASGPVMPASRFPVWLLAALLVLVTIALYWPATRYDFINYDDPEYVIANPQVQGGLNWAGVKWAFSNTEQAAYWAPVMWLSHMLACQLFGLNPWGHHLINVLLHAVNTALVFLLLRQMTVATWRSLVVAALFGLHPLRVESVAWVTERKDVLSTCFGLLALVYYARYAQNKAPLNSLSSVASAKEDQPSGAAKQSSEVVRRRKRSGDGSILNYILALLFFAFGLMSKAMLVTLPFVMLLLDYWPLERFKVQGSRPTPSLPHSITPLRRLLLEKRSFFALAAVMSIVTFVAQKHGGALVRFENMPLGARCGNALISYCRYLGKMFWPADLAIFYPHPGYWPLAQVLLAGGLLLGITVLFIVKRGRYPFLLMGWLWFVGTLVPVIQLVQSGDHAMADRYTYIPSLGVLIMAVWGAYELTRRWRYQAIVLSVAGCAAIVLCIRLTHQQLGYWQDDEILFRHALEVTENNYIIHDFLGTALLKKGQTDEAISQFQEAIRLKPDCADSHNNLGNALSRKGQTDEAIRQYHEAIRLNPDFADAHNNLATVLLMKGQNDEAISQFQEAIRLKPDYADAHNNLGIALGR